ncbi:conserved hypothetical protein [Vibrio phage 495E54-1]|nr:conserved hypothetical protein [Vibrio phage 495E54-1]
MTNNKALELLEHFLYSCSVLGISRTNFNVYFQDDEIVVQLSEESDFGGFVHHYLNPNDTWCDVIDKQSSQESVDKIEALHKDFLKWIER